MCDSKNESKMWKKAQEKTTQKRYIVNIISIMYVNNEVGSVQPIAEAVKKLEDADKANADALATLKASYETELAKTLSGHISEAVKQAKLLEEAMKEGAPLIHRNCPGNVRAHTQIRRGDLAKALEEPGLIKVEGWYETPTVQHCHIENFICYAYEEAGKTVIVSSTQIPHIVRRCVGQALGIPWGKVRIIKPYIGGGFGNKQDTLYEPLAAWLCTQVGGRTVKLDIPREDTFISNRIRHAERFHIISWVRPSDGTVVARKVDVFSNQGAYASHGHSIAAKGLNAIPQLYPCPNYCGNAYTVYTNRSCAGAMRGYGMPQASYAIECHVEDIAKELGVDSLEYRRKHLMPVGFVDG